MTRRTSISRLDDGYAVTDEDVERARRRLAAQPSITNEQHDRNMRWLRQFGDEPASAEAIERAEDAADVSAARDVLARIDAGDTPRPAQ
ncbi:hypothetical protein [Micromonospora sp. DT227]|uniref:hypothetical protein n=1 Tax=Micromonospora sp. DT227 TaxID=3393433 RepID=UPI003CEB0293